MRLFLRATRALISFATTAHIATLRGSVNLNTRRLNRAVKRTDAAHVAVHAAEQAVTHAKANKADMVAAERAVLAANRTFYKAAQAEADSLRRGVII